MKQVYARGFVTGIVSITLYLFIFSVYPITAQQIIVGENVLVSADHNTMYTETLIAADPKDPNRLLGCAIKLLDGARRRSTVVYASADSGKSWTQTLDTKDFFYSTDPAVAFALDGVAYFTALAKIKPESETRLVIYRSMDGGKTWRSLDDLPPIVNFDREYIVTDNTGGNYQGRIYINGTAITPGIDGTKHAYTVRLYSMREKQSSFRSVERVSLGDGFVYGMGNGVVLSDGTLAFLFAEVKDRKQAEAAVVSQRFGEHDVRQSTFDSRLKIAMSTDGGVSLSPAITIDDFHQSFSVFNSNVPYLAVDPGSSAFKDRLYAVWPDVRSGRSEILFSYSADKGKTWSEAKALNDDRPLANITSTANNFMPVVSVNTAGVVGVMWYDRRDTVDDLGWRVRFMASLNGGDTWLPSVPVSVSPANYGKAEKLFTRADTRGGSTVKLNIGLLGLQFAGADTAGLAADAAGAFHPFWVDNRSGTLQVWTTTINVKGDVWRHGSRDLMDLDDISEKVILDVIDTSYDRSTNLITASVRLKNRSTSILTGPIKLRTIKLQSALGMPEAVNADNDQKQEGAAVWDFSTSLDANALKPNETSAVKKLIFRLSNVQSFKQGNVFRYGVLNFEARVLGKLELPARNISGLKGVSAPTN